MSATKKHKLLVQLGASALAEIVAVDDGGSGVNGKEDGGGGRTSLRRQRKNEAEAPAAAPGAAPSAAAPAAAPAVAVPRSGVPIGLQGSGVGKLDAVSEKNLLLALVENGLPLPLPEEKEKAAYAKQQLLRKCVSFAHCKEDIWDLVCLFLLLECARCKSVN
eukprot:973882-Pleurochrysis_carterae.AAC.1